MPAPGLSGSALDIIKSSLRKLNVYQSNETIPEDEAQDCLVALNLMLDSWNADGLTIYTTQYLDFPLTGGVTQLDGSKKFTLGDGGDFNMPRPAEIDGASILIMSNPQQPIEYNLPIYTTQDWKEKVPVKGVAGNLPVLAYDDGAFPLRNITFWPSITENIRFRVYSWQPLGQFASLRTSVSYPPGYMEAIIFNLAVRLAPDFQTSVTPETSALAMSTLARIKTSNSDDTQLHSDIRNNVMTGVQMRAELFGIPTI